MKRLILILLIVIPTLVYGQFNIWSSVPAPQPALDPADFSGGKFIQESNGAFVPVTRSDILGYKSYVASLAQVGTENPTAIVFKSELDTITIIRNTPGVYTLTINGGFSVNKTDIRITNYAPDKINGNISYLQGGVINGEIKITQTSFVVDETINIDEFSCNIEIRVYY